MARLRFESSEVVRNLFLFQLLERHKPRFEQRIFQSELQQFMHRELHVKTCNVPQVHFQGFPTGEPCQHLHLIGIRDMHGTILRFRIPHKTPALTEGTNFP